MGLSGIRHSTDVPNFNEIDMWEVQRLREDRSKHLDDRHNLGRTIVATPVRGSINDIK